MSPLAAIVVQILNFYSLLIFAYVIMSWFPVRVDGVMADIYRVLASLAEPYIGIFRRIVPSTGALDFSPLIALIVLRYIIQPVLVSLVRTLSL